jgi:hypothetical protein
MSLEQDVSIWQLGRGRRLEPSSETFLTDHFEPESATGSEVFANKLQHAEIVRIVLKVSE